MKFSYNGLWKMLIDKNMKKKDLIDRTGISPTTISKMVRGDAVSLTVIGKICEELGSDIGDLICIEKDVKEDKWHLSPAYDLTYSNTYYGEHTTSVDGNGRNPGRKELLAVGTGAGMKKTRCEEIIDEIEKKVKEMLEEYLLGK